jgi:hypothetical protein
MSWAPPIEYRPANFSGEAHMVKSSEDINGEALRQLPMFLMMAPVARQQSVLASDTSSFGERNLRAACAVLLL